MHGWSQHVAFQTENQLADTIVCLGTNISQFFFERLCRPSLQSPVFIVDENATILDAWRLADHILLIIIDASVGLVNGNIGKPIPRTDTNLFADVENTVG